MSEFLGLPGDSVTFEDDENNLEGSCRNNVKYGNLDVAVEEADSSDVSALGNAGSVSSRFKGMKLSLAPEVEAFGAVQMGLNSERS